MKKMNMVSKYNAVKAMLNGETVEGFTLENALEFLNERIAQTEKKNASGSTGERKPTKEQIVNAGIKEQIIEYLGSCENPVTIADICKALGIESSQKVTALVSQELTIRKGVPNPNGRILRTEVKGKAHFEIAPTTEE